MGDIQIFSQRIGLTRGKAATIGVLAVALAVVMYVQYGGTSGDDFAPAYADGQRPRRTPRGESQGADDSSQPEHETITRVSSGIAGAFNPVIWKSPDLSTVVVYDPFALPASFPQSLHAELDARRARGSGGDAAASADGNELASAIEQYRMELEALEQRGVQVIVRGRDKYVAWIGDRMVHVGDDINGFTVTAIEPDGVRLERKVNP